MDDALTLEPRWADSLLVVTASYGSKPARRIGEAKGTFDGGGIGFLADIVLDKELEVRNGFLGMSKRNIPIRGKGFGKKLLARFEQEMAMKGAVVIQGNLVAESPDQLDWLIGWYREEGYDFRSGETVGELAPPDTAGVVSKTLARAASAPR